MLHVSFAGVVYNSPETPGAVRTALVLLTERLRELEARGQDTSAQDHGAGPVAGVETLQQTTTGAADVSARLASNGAAPQAEQAPMRGAAHHGARGRWFLDRWPRVSLRTGERTIFRSSQELQEFLVRNGLRPHKRGDASMLLWQVRRRLGLAVEAVPRPVDS